jgi:hypothetical protein
MQTKTLKVKQRKVRMSVLVTSALQENKQGSN